MSDSVWEWFRVFNAGLSLFVFALILAGTVARWDKVPIRFRRIIPWIAMTYGIIAYGSLEIVRSDVFVPPGFRVGLMTLTLLGLFVAMLYGIGDQSYVMARRRWQFFEDKGDRDIRQALEEESKKK